LEAKAHEVRVDRNGYERLPPRHVRIGAGSQQTVAFSLTLEGAKLELVGAPAGVEVRAGGKPLGRTDGSGTFLFPASVAPGDPPLQVTLGSASRVIPRRFEPGETVRLLWKDVAPAAPPTPAPAPEALETQAWDRVRSASDAAPLQAFLRSYPNGSHAREAESRMADLTWGAVDQTSVAAVRKFLSDNPANPHRSDAQRIVGQFEERSREEQTRQEALGQDLVKQQAAAQQEQLRQQVLETVRRLDAALQRRRTRDVKAIWPGASRAFLESLAVPGVKFSLTASDGDVRVWEPPDRATVQGGLATNINGTTTLQKATLTLRNSGGGWMVESARFE
jgi:hypothetical protein